MFIFSKKNKLEFDNFIEHINSDGGAVLINKPTDWTSFDVVAKLRNLLQCKKIGHCGTLDPFATGVLILCLGKATKKIEEFQNQPKQYLATIKLGATTKTLDIEATEENICDVSNLSIVDIENVVQKFVGNIEQVPPMYSAKKIQGKKLYELARKNIEIELPPSNVEIYSIKIVQIKLPNIEILVDCSKGTYIRALARDIGKELKVGGYLTKLSRTKIGEYNIDDCLDISDIKKLEKTELVLK